MSHEKRGNRFIDYNRSVFVNCPFDVAYTPLFRSTVFTLIRCGFRVRCALEDDDASQVRIENIFRIIEECKFGIHDLSRTESDRKTGLPRFNMPLELGMFLGMKRSGSARQKRKVCLVFDRHQYRYRAFISDIAGQDIKAHRLKDANAITIIRNWLRAGSSGDLPGGKEIIRQYRKFKSRLPILCLRSKLHPSEMTFNDFVSMVIAWLKVELSKTVVEKQVKPKRAR